MKNYFPHDHYARSDKKLINLIRVQGLAGVGLFWCIIEMLYEENGWLNLSDLENIAYDLRTPPEKIKSLIYDFDLFYTNGEKFTSKSVQVRLKLMEAKSSQAAKAAKARWQKCKDDANAMRTHTISNALNKSKLNEIKENESKGENSASLSPELFENEISEGLEKKEKPKEKKVAPKKEKVSRVDWKHLLELPYSEAFAEKWEEYISYRKTPYANQKIEQRVLTKLSAYNEAFAIHHIDRAMESGWTGLIFPETDNDFKKFLASKKNEQASNHNEPTSGPSNAVRLAWSIAS